jgi:hypothetical protein
MIYCQTIEESPMFRKLYVVENIKHGTRCTNRKSRNFMCQSHRRIGICMHVYRFSLVLSRFPRIWCYWWRMHCTFVVFCMLTLISVCFVPIYNDFRIIFYQILRSSVLLFCTVHYYRPLSLPEQLSSSRFLVRFVFFLF